VWERRRERLKTGVMFEGGVFSLAGGRGSSLALWRS
jgi:hypothetical protein